MIELFLQVKLSDFKLILTRNGIHSEFQQVQIYSKRRGGGQPCQALCLKPDSDPIVKILANSFKM